MDKQTTRSGSNGFHSNFSLEEGPMNKFFGLIAIAFLFVSSCNIDKGEIGAACRVADDCKSGFCKNDSCAPPDFCAQNEIKDGNETDVDCGGIFCVKCGGGKSCLHGSDCLSGTCINNTCTFPPDAGANSTDGGTDGSSSGGDAMSSTDGGNVTPDGGSSGDLANANDGGSVDQQSSCALTLCNGQCVDTASDNAHCGRCGNICAGGQTCQQGVCNCLKGDGFCNGKCINIASDTSNCGQCGKLCQPGEFCSAGNCEVQCGKPSVICNGNACVDLVHDPRHCGGCNVACSAQNMVSVTCQDFCNGTCKLGFDDCDGDKQGNGCEVNLTSDPKHCGKCGTVCPARPNSAPSCEKEKCGSMCSPNFGECDFDLSNGCEADLLTNRFNCGGCGNACAQNEACMAGKCIPQCAQGQTSCNKVCTDTQSDVKNCGGCNTACQQNEACMAGKCVQLAPQTLYIEASAADQMACSGQLIVVAFGPDGEHRSMAGQPLSIAIDQRWGGFLYYSIICNGSYANWNQMADRTPVNARFKSVKPRGQEFVNSSTICPDVVAGGKKPKVMMDGSPPC